MQIIFVLTKVPARDTMVVPNKSNKSEQNGVVRGIFCLAVCNNYK